MANDTWQTPRYIINWIQRETGLEFCLDVAASESNKICNMCYTEETNGLIQPWAEAMLAMVFLYDTPAIWMNPPYSDPYPWVEKAFKESQKGCNICCLLPADISTKWFHEQVIGRAEIWFIQGRISFDSPIDGKYSAPKFGSLLAFYGPQFDPKIIKGVKRPERI